MAEEGVKGGGEREEKREREREREREGEREREKERETVLLVFIRANFLIFFLCAFWRLRLDPLQMQRGTGQRRNGKVPAARHASPPPEEEEREDHNTQINNETEGEQGRCVYQVSMHKSPSAGCKCVSALNVKAAGASVCTSVSLCFVAYLCTVMWVWPRPLSLCAIYMHIANNSPVSAAVLLWFMYSMVQTRACVRQIHELWGGFAAVLWGQWIARYCGSLRGLTAPGSEVMHTQTLILLHFKSLDLIQSTDLISYDYINRAHKHSESRSTCALTQMDACNPELTFRCRNHPDSVLWVISSWAWDWKY